MADISNVKRFKEINDTDNILVKEIDIFKKSTYTEIANTVQKYIDIETEIENVLAKRSVFFDTFLERGISPYMRMTCDVQVLDSGEKTLLLTQRALFANQKVRYENIDIKYMENAILEIVIDSFPSEITDRTGWRIERIETPTPLIFRRSTAINLQQSYVLISNITLGRPIKFSFSTFQSNNVWSPVFDTFLGSVQAYGASTGLDGYEPFLPSEGDSYLRFITSREELEALQESISRSKNIDIRKNNISKKIYVEENPIGNLNNTLEGIDIEFGVSNIPTGKGVNSLGVRLIQKDELSEDRGFRIGSHEIGTIKASYNKLHKGLSEFLIGNFICATVDSDKEYLSKDYPYFVSKYNISSSTFKVKDYVFKVDNPFNLSLDKFSGYEVSHTNKVEEYGVVFSGKSSFQLGASLGSTDPNDFVQGTGSDIPLAGDVINLGKIAEAEKTNLILEPGSKRFIFVAEDFLANGKFVDSGIRTGESRRPGDISSWFYLKPGAGKGAYPLEYTAFIPVSSAITNRKPSVPIIFYVPIGFI